MKIKFQIKNDNGLIMIYPGISSIDCYEDSLFLNYYLDTVINPVITHPKELRKLKTYREIDNIYKEMRRISEPLKQKIEELKQKL